MSLDRPSTDQNRIARGVVPHQPDDPVLKAPYAHGALLFATLRPDLDRDGLQAWLTRIEDQVQRLRAALDEGGNRVATVAVGFGPSLFLVPGTGQPRFPGIQPPAGFAQLPTVPQGAPVGADVVFYLVATAEAEIARFLRGIADDPTVSTMTLEPGYKSRPDRDVFGYADGLRNARDHRNDTVFTDPDRHPDEPAWALRGTYLAYLRVTQDRHPFDALTPEEQDQIIGRDREGRRLDLPAASDVAAEPGFAGDLPAGCAHIRKTGPRGSAAQDATQIFRRGLPFYEIGADGRLVEGLQFVSFQASLDQFDTILNRWMFNPDFPHPGAGVDALFARNAATIQRWGFYFVPPDTDTPLGTGMLQDPPAKRPTKTGRVAVRKQIVDSTGARSNPDLGGFTFQIATLDGTAVGAPFTTDSAGHAVSEEVPAGDYQLLELPPPPPFTPAPPQQFTLTNGQALLRVTNTVPPGSPGYI